MSSLKKFLLLSKDNTEVFEELQKMKKKCLKGKIPLKNQEEYIHDGMKKIAKENNLDISITETADEALGKIPLSDDELAEVWGGLGIFPKSAISLFALLFLSSSGSLMKKPVSALVPEVAYTTQVSQKFTDFARIQEVNAMFEKIAKREDFSPFEKATEQVKICNAIRKDDLSFDFRLTAIFENIGLYELNHKEVYDLQSYIEQRKSTLTCPDKMILFNEKVFYRLSPQCQIDIRPYDQKRDILSNDKVPKLKWPDNDGFLIDRDTLKPVKEECPIIRAGMKIDRYGTPRGLFVSPMKPDGTPYEFEKRALPYINNQLSYHKYIVKKDITAENIFNAIIQSDDTDLVSDILDKIRRLKGSVDKSDLLVSDFVMYEGKIQPAFSYNVDDGDEAVQIKLPIWLEYYIQLSFVEEIDMPDIYKENAYEKLVLERDDSKDKSVLPEQIATISKLRETVERLDLNYLQVNFGGMPIGENEIGVRSENGMWLVYESDDRGLFSFRIYYSKELDAANHTFNLILEEDRRRRRFAKKRLKGKI